MSEGHSSHVHSVAITSDNTKIVSGSEDNTIKVWKIQKAKYSSNYKIDSGILSISILKNENIILISDKSRNLYLASLFQSAADKVFRVKPPIIEQ